MFKLELKQKWLLLLCVLPGMVHASEPNHPYPGFRLERRTVRTAVGTQENIRGSFSLREYYVEKGMPIPSSLSVESPAVSSELSLPSPTIERSGNAAQPVSPAFSAPSPLLQGPLLAGGGRVGGGEGPRQFAGPLWAPQGEEWCLAHTSTILQTLREEQMKSVERGQEQAQLELLASLLYLIKNRLESPRVDVNGETYSYTHSLAYKTVFFFTSTLEELLEGIGHDQASFLNTLNFLERGFEFLAANGELLDTTDRKFYIPYVIQNHQVPVLEADLNRLNLSFNLLEWFFVGARVPGYDPECAMRAQELIDSRGPNGSTAIPANLAACWRAKPVWLASPKNQGFVSARNVDNGAYYFAKGSDFVTLTILKRIFFTLESELGPGSSVFYRLYQCRMESMLPVRNRIINFYDGDQTVYRQSKILLNYATAEALSFVRPGPNYLKPCNSIQELIQAGQTIHPGAAQPRR